MTIVPDDKDWTWILDQPCPECGADVTTLTAAEVPGALRDQVARWHSALTGPGLTVRPRPDTWSTTEYAAHVRDVYRRFGARVRLMVDEDDPVFANWDQDLTAIEDRYDLQQPEVVSVELAEAGEALAVTFEDVTDWDRPGRRSNGSVFTILTLARYLVHDPEHHLWDVRPLGAWVGIDQGGDFR
jgi:hypothetical protein